jgi:hypothetical protein
MPVLGFVNDGAGLLAPPKSGSKAPQGAFGFSGPGIAWGRAARNGKVAQWQQSVVTVTTPQRVHDQAQLGAAAIMPARKAAVRARGPARRVRGGLVGRAAAVLDQVGGCPNSYRERTVTTSAGSA